MVPITRADNPAHDAGTTDPEGTRMRLQRYPRGLDVALDATILFLGLAIFAGSILQWATSGHPIDLVDIGGVALIVVMARYPVVLPQRGGDAVIGFEISALVFL